MGKHPNKHIKVCVLFQLLIWKIMKSIRVLTTTSDAVKRKIFISCFVWWEAPKKLTHRLIHHDRLLPHGAPNCRRLKLRWVISCSSM